jgi:hypothetical protein
MSNNYNGIRESSKIIINSEHENLVPEISDSEVEGTELDPYRQMGVSGDTLEIYNDLIASDRRLRREKG